MCLVYLSLTIDTVLQGGLSQATGVPTADDSSRFARPSAVSATRRDSTAMPTETIYDAFPGLCDAVQPTNAPATARALHEAGFAVTYTLLDPGVPPGSRGTLVNRPPPDTVIVSVLDAEGSYAGIQNRTRQLNVEVATDPGIEPIGRDVACSDDGGK